MATTAKTYPEEHNIEDEVNAPAADDEDTGAHAAPIVKLEEVAVTTGEEDKDPMLDPVTSSYSDCKSFMEMAQEVAESRGKKEENKDATFTADLLEKSSVGGNNSDGKEQVEKAAASEDKEAVEDEPKTVEDKKDEPATQEYT